MSEIGRIKLSQIAPSVVTVFAICAGLTSVRMSLEGHLEFALFYILIAVFLDAVDGKLARYLDTASPFGAELDTLADFFNFGIAPGFCCITRFISIRNTPTLAGLPRWFWPSAVRCASRGLTSLAAMHLQQSRQKVSLSASPPLRLLASR